MKNNIQLRWKDFDEVLFNIFERLIYLKVGIQNYDSVD